MKNTFILVAVVLVGWFAYAIIAGNQSDPVASNDGLQFTTELSDRNQVSDVEVIVHPIEHATFVLQLGDVVVYNDPVGDPAAFSSYPEADLGLVSDIHGDHLNAETLAAVLSEQSILVAPQAVVDELPAELASRAMVLANGEQVELAGVAIEAVAMYNLPIDGEGYRHVKGRGNGYVLEYQGERIYIAGDTEDIEEMRALADIDRAFIPMNLPYTMDVEAAAAGVLAFAPKIVYPYHYRGSDGLSDVGEFKRLVNEGNPSIDVQLLEWYPNAN